MKGIPRGIKMNKIKALLVVALLSLSSVSNATTVTAGTTVGSEGTINLVTNDGGTTLFGNFGQLIGDYTDGITATVFYDLNVLPSDSTAISIGTSNQASGTIYSIFFELFEKESGILVAMGDSISAALMASTDYILQLTGQTGTSYTVDVAAVPVPAAGILFASALLGAGAFGRRKKKSAQNQMVGAFTRAS